MPLIPMASQLDLSGKALSNKVTNEYHEFGRDPLMRIFAPHYGPFYTASVVISDASTGRKLELNRDYRLLEFYKEATELSGQEVCTLIQILSESTVEAYVSYQFVGGIYQSVTPVVNQLMERYPDGIEPTYKWHNILQKPLEYPAAAHLHHIDELHGLSPLVSALEKIRIGLTEADSNRYLDLYQVTEAHQASLLKKIEDTRTELIAKAEDVQRKTEVGEGEFIWTDNPNNPATYKGYGTWARRPNELLQGGEIGQAGQGVVVAEGADHPVRLTYLWQRTDNVVFPTYTLTANRTQINEGQSVVITLETTAIATGTSIPWRIINSGPADINGPMEGTFVVNAQGKATVTITAANDLTTDGDKDMRIQLRYYPSVFVDVKVVDTSKSPTYELYYSTDAAGNNRVTQVNEGTIFYLNIILGNVPTNTKLNLNWAAGTLTSNDLASAFPSSITAASNGIHRIKMELLNDSLTEGTEIAVCNLLPSTTTNDLGKSLARAELIVNDTSRKAAYDMYFSRDVLGQQPINYVDEGEEFYLQLRTENVDTGTEFDVIIGGTANTADLKDYATRLKVFSGVANGVFSTTSDRTSEGAEVLSVSLTEVGGTKSLVTASVTINDTSLTPKYSVWASADAGGAVALMEVNEGSNFYLNFRSENVPDGTPVTLQYTNDKGHGYSVIQQDFNDILPTTFVMNDNQGQLLYRVRNDYTEESVETLTISVIDMGILVDRVNILIRDTSVQTYAAKFSNNATGTGSITHTSENSTAYFVIETQGVPDQDTVSLSYSGTIGASDLAGANKTTATIVGGKAILPFTFVKDYLTEGGETLTISVAHRGAVRATATLTINDTSITPVVTVVPSLTTSRVSTATINEGAPLYMHIDVENVPDGGTLKWEIVHNGTTASDFSATSGTINIIPGQRAYVPTLNIVSDKATESTVERFQVKVTLTTDIATTVVATSSMVTIVDTSKTETFEVYYSSDAAGNNKITQVNEGSVFYVNIRTENIPAGTNFRLDYPSTGTGYVADSDLETAIGAKVYTLSGTNPVKTISVSNRAKADATTEGDENLVLQCTRMDTQTKVTSTTLKIIDTSRTFSSTARWMTNAGLLVNTFAEGTVGNILQITCTNAVVGNVYAAELVTSAADAVGYDDLLNSHIDTQLTALGENAIFSWGFDIKADRLTEGNEKLYVRFRNVTTNTVHNTFSVAVSDTSRAISVNLRWLNSTGNVITSINETNNTGFKLEAVVLNSAAGDNWTLTLLTGAGRVTTADLETSSFVSRVAGGTGTETWSWNYVPKADRLTESNETMVVRLTNTTTGQTWDSPTLTVNDDSKTPSFVANYSKYENGTSPITQVGEGEVFYLYLRPDNPVNGDTFKLTLNTGAGIAVAGTDFTLDTPTTLTYNGGNVIAWKFTTIADNFTDGDMKISAKVEGVSPALPAQTYVIDLVDSSKSPVASISWRNASGTTITSANEGATVKLRATLVNPMVGTTVTPQLVSSTNGITLADLSSSDFTTKVVSASEGGRGKTVIYDWTYVISNDRASEGVEYFYVDVKEGNGRTTRAPTLTVNDTSKAVSSIVGKWYTAASGGTEMNSVDEGATTYLRLTPTGGVSGDTYTMTLNSGTGIATSGTDYNMTSPTTQTWVSGALTWQFNLLADEITEATAENISVTIKNNQTGQSWNYTLKVNDTSKTPSIDEVFFATNATGTIKTTSINEGTTVYAIVKTSNIPNGTTVTLDFSGSTTTAADFDNNSFPTTVTVTLNNNLASHRLDVKADRLTD